MRAFGLVNCKTICELGLTLSDDLVAFVRFGRNHVWHFGSRLDSFCYTDYLLAERVYLDFSRIQTLHLLFSLAAKYFGMVGNKMSRCLFVASRSHLALLLLGLGNLKCTESL